MAGNRTKVEAFIIKQISLLVDGEENNIKRYKDFFASMNDKQFEKFIDDLATGKKFLSVEMPNFGKKELSVERNLKIADDIGHSFFQRLWIEGKGDTPTYLTPIEYLVVDLPIRRASQLLTKKISVPKHNKVIDALTGQPTGESKGAKISYPELQVLSAMGMEKSLIELVKYRGGDARGRAAMSGMLSKFGKVRIDSLKPYASGVESTNTVRTFLLAAHLRSTL